MSTALQHMDPIEGLSQWRPPEKVMEEARKAAVVLQEVISLKKNPVIFNKEQYLEFEDWQTVAKFYGCTSKVVSTGYVEFGGVQGFEATAIVLDRNQNEISRAESMCLNDEDNWGEVPVYEWEDELDANGKKIWIPPTGNKKGHYKGKRVQAGSKPKPLFQLRSMAQTRAQAKALKNVFSWVVVLAGYKATPAEEMTGHEFDNEPEHREQVQQPGRASEKKPEQTQQAATHNANPAEQVHSGIIETVKPGKDGAIWLSLKSGLIIFVVEKYIDSDMKPDMFIKFRGLLQKRATMDFWEFLGLIELTKVQDGEPVKEEKTLTDDARQAADDMEKIERGENPTVQGLVDAGVVTTASSLPEGSGKKPGTIGKKRAQRLYTLCTQNKATNFGFNETEIKKILASLPVPLEHLTDLETSMHDQFEAWAMGKEDWHQYWEKD